MNNYISRLKHIDSYISLTQVYGVDDSMWNVTECKSICSPTNWTDLYHMTVNYISEETLHKYIKSRFYD